MTVSLACHCPHCLHERIGFTFVAQSHAPIDGRTYWQVMFRCNGCQKPVVAQFRSTCVPDKDMHGNLIEHAGINDLEFFPKFQPPVAPEHLPALVAQAFLEADIALRTGSFNAAVAMDRRVLEIVTKLHAPDKARMNLHRRIEFLSETGQLTASLKTWAHQLRSLGNDALHDMENMDADTARQTHDLTRFILIYLYTLPQQISLAQQPADDGPAGQDGG